MTTPMCTSGSWRKCTRKRLSGYASNGYPAEAESVAHEPAEMIVDNTGLLPVYLEERINLLGMCEGTNLHVTYTERGERIRIISARRAEKHERDDYDRENSL